MGGFSVVFGRGEGIFRSIRQGIPLGPLIRRRIVGVDVIEADLSRRVAGHAAEHGNSMVVAIPYHAGKI